MVSCAGSRMIYLFDGWSTDRRYTRPIWWTRCSGVGTGSRPGYGRSTGSNEARSCHFPFTRAFSSSNQCSTTTMLAGLPFGLPSPRALSLSKGRRRLICSTSPAS